MKDLNGVIIGVATVATGVFVAGYLMNMFRSTGAVKDAINGFDA